MTYKRILVPVDGSPTSNKGLDEAAKLAAAIEMLYVDPSVPDDPFAGRPPSDRDAAEGERLYTTLGCRACHIIGASGGYLGPPLSDTRTRLKPGWVFRHLQNPQRWRADLIVMGTHGRRGVNRLLLGSSAELVVRNSTIPVLLIPGEAKRAGQARR